MIRRKGITVLTASTDSSMPVPASAREFLAKGLLSYLGERSGRLLKSPPWVEVGRARRLWAEDDATVHTRGREGLDEAYRRLFKTPVPEALESHDDGDCVYYRLPGGVPEFCT